MKLPSTVVNFHVIQDSYWMEKILKVLIRYYKIVSVEDLRRFYLQGQDIRNACHITVDDGDISVYTHLFPLLKKYRVPISIYVSPMTVITGRNFWFQEIEGYDLEHLLRNYNDKYNTRHEFVGKNQVYGLVKSLKLKEIHELIDEFKALNRISYKPRRCMTLDQLKELKASGLVEIGAHTMHHPILSNETVETVREEIQQSIEKLGEMLGEKVKYFAYPNGVPVYDFGLREMDVLSDCGIELAFSTQAKNFTIDDHPLSVPRRGITKGGSVFVLAKLALGDGWEGLKRLLKGKQEPDFRRMKGD
jgi:peptidoglycan/xylan/chitin deacetylase (PgdA/CDA1 family)